MRDMQTKILDAIEKAASADGVDVVRTSDYANTGRVYVQREWDTLLELSYSFQSSYCSITVTGKAVPDGPILWPDGAAPGGNRYAAIKGRDRGRGSGVEFPHLDYVDADRIRLLLDIVRQAAVA